MQQHTYEQIDFPPLTDEQRAELKELDAMSDSEIDTSDIPETLDTPIMHYYFKSLKVPKKTIHTVIDLDTLDWLKSAGAKGYQRKMNNVLRWARMNNCPIAQM